MDPGFRRGDGRAGVDFCYAFLRGRLWLGRAHDNGDETMADLPKPDYATSNMRLVGYSDQGGRCDGVQIMVRNGYAYIGHIFSKGFTVVDVRDPKKPKAGKYFAPPPH